VFADNSIGPIIGAMSVVIVATILTTMDIPVFYALKPFLFTNHMINWKGFFDRPVDVREVLKSALVLLFHIVLFVSLAVYFFRKKDVDRRRDEQHAEPDTGGDGRPGERAAQRYRDRRDERV
jgi:ABC-2 type transport system permease protein